MNRTPAASGDRKPVIEQESLLRPGTIVLAAEVLALGLLWLREGVYWSLGLSGAAALLALNWHVAVWGKNRLVHSARRAMRGIRGVIGNVHTQVLSRRTWRFRVSTLLLVVLLSALPCAWFSHRFHRVEREQNSLNGTWRVLDWNGIPVVIRGKPITIELKSDNYVVDPTRRPAWIDFRVLGTSGRSKAIYYWDGGRLRVCQESGGMVNRPATFDGSEGGRYVLERTGR